MVDPWFLASKLGDDVVISHDGALSFHDRSCLLTGTNEFERSGQRQPHRARDPAQILEMKWVKWETLLEVRGMLATSKAQTPIRPACLSAEVPRQFQ